VAGAVDESRIREGFAGAGFADAEVTRLGPVEDQEFLVRLNTSEEEEKDKRGARPVAGTAARRAETVEDADPAQAEAAALAAEEEEVASGLLGAVQRSLTADLGVPVEFNSVQSVGPRAGSELTQSAFWSFVVTSALILLYIWLRFDLRYAPGAVVAVVHDVIVTVGVFAWFQIEFDLNIVAALLVILGYQINDTIVIYDRIRENVARGHSLVREVVNQSLNQTLSRTILTNSFTLTVVISILVFGGPVLRGLSFALLIGMLSGVYSTIYVASALLIWLAERTTGAGRAAPAT
jgi:preprotein translocase subunit SecF